MICDLHLSNSLAKLCLQSNKINFLLQLYCPGDNSNKDLSKCFVQPTVLKVSIHLNSPFTERVVSHKEGNLSDMNVSSVLKRAFFFEVRLASFVTACDWSVLPPGTCTDRDHTA